MVEVSLKDAQAQLLHVQKLFPRVLKFDRVEKFQSQNGFFSGISFLPESFRRPAKQLELGRRELLQCFYEAEAGLEIDQTAFEGIDGLFVKLFTEVKDEPGNTKLFSLNDFLRSSEKSKRQQKQKKWIKKPKWQQKQKKWIYLPQPLALPLGGRGRSQESSEAT